MHLSNSSRVRLAALVASGIAVSVTSCSVGVHVETESSFQTQWVTSWSAINEAAKPWNASGTLPGVCNKGGSASDCVKTDGEVILALDSFVTTFQTASFVPRSLGGRVAQVVTAVRTDLKGIRDRDKAIRTSNDALYSTALTEFGQAATELKNAYNSIPADDRPLPLPFDGRQMN